MRVYRKDEHGYYRYSIFNYLALWLSISFLGFVFSLLLPKSNYIFISVKVVFLILTFIFGLIELIKVIVGSIKNKSLISYIYSLELESAIRQALLSTMTLNLRKDSPTIEVPAIKVIFSDSKIVVCIQKLPGMDDIDKVEENINSSFRGKFRSFAVTTKIQQDNGTEFKFILEDVGTDKTFCPKSIRDLVQKPYFLTFQDGLTINLSKSPHIAVWGQTGSGKTTVLMNIIAQCLSNGTDLLFIDGKTEFSSFSVFYSSRKIASDNENILDLLQGVSEAIGKRQRVVADEVKRRHELGLTGYDIGLKPIVIVADEVGSVVASMDNKKKKKLVSYLTQIVQKGRSVGVFLVMATQSPAVDVLPSGIRNQFSVKILLGGASGDSQRMAFDQVATSGGVEKFQGYYMISGKTIQPQKYYVPNLIAYNLNNLQVFEKLYKIGKNKRTS